MQTVNTQIGRVLLPSNQGLHYFQYLIFIFFQQTKSNGSKVWYSSTKK